jgi:hypothetical protein
VARWRRLGRRIAWLGPMHRAAGGGCPPTQRVATKRGAR